MHLLDGYTHANWLFTDEIIKNVISLDECSAYPYTMCTHKFPMNEFIKSHLTVDRLLEAYKNVTAGCRWKSAVQRVGHDKLSLCVQLYDDIMNDRYKTQPPQKFVIFERGKRRVISNLVMRDKVLQRFLCDYCLVPYLDRFFIYDNSASRKGKGVVAMTIILVLCI